MSDKFNVKRRVRRGTGGSLGSAHGLKIDHGIRFLAWNQDEEREHRAGSGCNHRGRDRESLLHQDSAFGSDRS